ncbi:hypothetical protein [Devosia sp.]|uniref:hypothetical protein n=1 Tax=Devosia sp. TaxID=1871048 RepID=UPI003A942496
MADTKKHDITLRRTGGAGPNSNWQWEIRKDGQVIKQGTALGDEGRAFATARKVADKLAKG